MFNEAMEDVGVCIDRMCDRVDRIFRRIRWGMMTGIDGRHDSGILAMEKKRWVESSPPKEK